MNEKTKTFVDGMKAQTIGCEVEMNNISRECAARTAAKFFGTDKWESTAWKHGYNCVSAWDAQGREWKFQHDCSIHGPADHRCEMVTPALVYDDIELLQELLRTLRHAGAKSDPARGCGVHIHIGGEGQTPQSLRNLANIMAAHEDLLINALNLDNMRIHSYCSPVDTCFLHELNAKKPTTMSDFADIWYGTQTHDGRNQHYNHSRYHMLNLHSFFMHGTVEFRLFQFDAPTDEHRGGIHAGQMKAYIQLCLALCQMAKTVKSASPQKTQIENPKYAMRCWLLRLGFIGEEFATARDILTRRLPGDTAFRDGRRIAS